jgi:hypothetical protein
MQDKFNGSELDNFVSMPMTFDGRALFEIVNTNGLLLFDYKLIKLPKSLALVRVSRTGTGSAAIRHSLFQHSWFLKTADSIRTCLQKFRFNFHKL